MSKGKPTADGTLILIMAPCGETTSMNPAGSAANTGPGPDPVIAPAPSLGAGIWNSRIVPSPLIRPILVVLYSVNHIAPPAPAVIWYGPAFAVGTVNSVIAPVPLIRPILFAANSVNHIEPSGPAAMSKGSAPGAGIRNTLIARTAIPSVPEDGIASGGPCVHDAPAGLSGCRVKKAMSKLSPAAAPISPNQVWPPEGKVSPWTATPAGHDSHACVSTPPVPLACRATGPHLSQPA